MKTKLPPASVALETCTPRMIALGLLAVLALLAVTGCQSAATTSAKASPAGVYTLVSVDGKAVPCNLAHEGAAMVVKSGSLTLNPDGTCRCLSTFCIPPHPDIQREVNATYTRDGAELTLRWQGAGTTQGTLQGDRFTMNNEGMIFSYRK